MFDYSIFPQFKPTPISKLTKLLLFFSKTYRSEDVEGNIKSVVYAKRLKGVMYIIRYELYENDKLIKLERI